MATMKRVQLIAKVGGPTRSLPVCQTCTPSPALCVQQALEVKWSYNFEGTTTLQSVLDAFCADHGLSAEHARLSDHHSCPVLLDTVSKMSKLCFRNRAAV